MNYLLLTIVIIANALQNIFQKQYNLNSKAPDTLLFSSFSAFAGFVFFLVCGKFHIDFNPQILPYSFAFALSYGAAVFGLLNAVKYGSLAITMLVFSYSLIIPTLYGIIFLNDNLSLIAYIGIFLLLISLYLINIKKGTVKFSSKWIIYLSVAFLGNGLCSTFQKMQQMKFNGAYKNELMIFSLLIVFFALLILSLLNKRDKDLKSCFYYSIPNGISNAVVNLFVMLLTGSIPNAILFPCISAGGIAVSFVIATLIYKEHLSKAQTIGYIAGIISVVLLNL